VTCYWRWRVGRFELHCTLYSRPRPGVCEAVELRLFRTLGDRGYPLLSIGSPAGTDPSADRVRSRPVADAIRRSGPLRPRTSRQGTTSPIITTLILVLLCCERITRLD
jgi:hypothetical protein